MPVEQSPQDKIKNTDPGDVPNSADGSGVFLKTSFLGSLVTNQHLDMLVHRVKG